MNETQKNIETCLAENILAEVASVPQDPQFRSLVNESLDPLKQQAAEQEGDEAYEKIVWTHKPYTFTSQVKQMKSNLILLLRRLWRFPFGRGTIRSLSDAGSLRSLADMWSHYIDRLQGNATYGIPSRLDQLTDLPSAPSLLSDRKISGVPEAADGLSVLQLLCTANSYTELRDDNSWIMTKEIPWSLFPSVNKLHLGCKECYVPIVNRDLTEFSAEHLEYFENNSNIKVIAGITSLPKLRFPVLKKLRLYNVYASQAAGGFIWGCSGVHEVEMPEFEEVTTSLTHVAILCNNENLEKWDAPNFRKINNCEYLVYDCPALWYVRFGTLVYDFRNAYGSYENNFVNSTSNLRHFELCADGGTLAISLHLNWWNPTNVLADQNNLQQFLSNFRSFIILRLANRKSTAALTLTLSAAVYNAVTGADSGWASLHTLADLGITDNDLTDLETDLGITSATIYATWLDTFTGANGIHWDINKAN